jgi:uncharacterized protein
MSLMREFPDSVVKLLACPACKGRIIYNKTKSGLVCEGCGRRYPIKDGIPRMIVK